MQNKLTSTFINTLMPEKEAFEVVDTDLKGFLLRVQPTGRKTAYYAYRNLEGKRQRVKVGTLGSITIRQARDQAEQYAAAVTQGIDVQGEKKTQKARAHDVKEKTLEYFLENHYSPWVKINRKSGAVTLEKINCHFSDLYPLQLDKINIFRIEQWRTEKLKEGMKPATANRVVAALRAVLSKAVEWEVIELHPLAKLKPLRVDASPNVRYLSDKEEMRLQEALEKYDQDLKDARSRGNEFREKRGYEPLPAFTEREFANRIVPMVKISLKTGIRQGELFELQWRDVDLEKEFITIRAENSKSNRTRHIPLSPIAFEMLARWRDQNKSAIDHARVFPGKEGRRLNNVKKSWAQILQQAKISAFRWHDMRHDFASKLVMKGAPLNTVRELCGHTDMNTTLRYAHLAPEHKAEAVALLG